MKGDDLMFVATMDSEHFEWMALGKTEKEALEALRQAWNRNQREAYKHYGGDMWLVETPNELMEYYGVWVEELKPGQCKWR